MDERKVLKNKVFSKTLWTFYLRNPGGILNSPKIQKTLILQGILTFYVCKLKIDLELFCILANNFYWLDFIIFWKKMQEKIKIFTTTKIKRRNIIMATREEKYIENLHDKFTTLLEKLMETESVEYENKTLILNDMKLMIDYYIRQLNNDLW